MVGTTEDDPHPRGAQAGADERRLHVLGTLIGGTGAGFGDGEAVEEAALVTLAESHGIAPLVHERLRAGAAWTGLGVGARNRLHALAVAEATADALHEAATREALTALAAAGVDTIVYKGAALAQTLYPRPELRPRADVDLLVHPERAAAARGALESAGYRAPPITAGALVIHQCALVRRTPRGLTHTVDLHWRLSNRPGIAFRLDYDTLRARAVPLPGAGPGALAPDHPDAMLIACLHLDGHHRGDERLLWLYDLHLLVTTLDRPGLAAFVERAHSSGLEKACARALALARHRFGTPLPEGIRAEPAKLGPPARRWRVLLEDLGAVPDWGTRARLLREHAFPPADYMLARAGETRRARLPVLYAARLLRAARRLFARQS